MPSRRRRAAHRSGSVRRGRRRRWACGRAYPMRYDPTPVPWRPTRRPRSTMFATLLGVLPRPPGTDNDDDAVRTALEAQERAGLEPLTDGRLRAESPSPVVAWQLAAAQTPRAVKAAM